MSILPLLYDDVVERATARGAIRVLPVRYVLSAQVFKIDDCVPVIQSLPIGQLQTMRKRPPFDNVWCEWSHVFDQGVRVTTAMWLVRARVSGSDAATRLEGFPDGPTPDIDDRTGLVNGFLAKHPDIRTLWMAYLFHRLDAAGTSTVNRRCVGEVLVTKEQPLLGLCADGATTYLCEAAGSHVDKLAAAMADGTESYTTMFDHGDDVPSLSSVFWPGWFCFALLHCRNVVSETWRPSDFIQKSRRRSGRPARSGYRVLKIEVPSSAVSSGRYTGTEADGPMVRLHVCRGHFRTFRADRYRESVRGTTIFVPQHLRGCRDLGTVDGPHVLTTKE